MTTESGVVTVEWGVRRPDGSVAGGMSNGEACGFLVHVPGGVLVYRVPGEWQSALTGGSGTESGSAPNANAHSRAVDDD